MDEDELERAARELPTGEGRLWGVVVVRAFRRNTLFFTDPDSTFPVAAGCLGWDVADVREKIKRRACRATFNQEARTSTAGEDRRPD